MKRHRPPWGARAALTVLAVALAVPVTSASAQPTATPSPIHVDRPTSVSDVAYQPWKPQEPVVTTDVPAAPVAWPGNASIASVAAADRSAGQFDVKVHDQRASTAAGITGVLVNVQRTDAAKARGGKASLKLDYSSFSGAVGGDWAARLKLFAMPACAAVTPDRAECQTMAPVPSRNDHAAKAVSANVDVAGDNAVFALAAGPEGVAGDYAATKLAQSAKWQVGTNTGSFSWKYAMRTPPVPSKLQPDLQLEYSAASVDGRTAGSNSQPSWIGEGWELWPGRITRSYRSCTDDTKDVAKRTGDQCWAGEDHVSIVYGDVAGELVFDKNKNTWRLSNDDGSRVERLHNAANGDNDGEHWRITTTEGTEYHFGSRPKDEAQSTWVVPVIGNDKDEPCHNTSSFENSRCDQAWQWNLDKVVDRHGNTIHYFYEKENNNYGFFRGKTKLEYTRGGVLRRIEYGTNDRVPGTAPVRVLLDVGDRCVPGKDCGQRNRESWPDVPWDQQCDSGACKDKVTPTFFSAKRLSKVTTEVWDGGRYTPVDSWSLTPAYPNPGDGTSAQLWLQELQQTGLVGAPATSPPVTFVGVARPNRVNAPNDGLPPVNKVRLYAIRNETGGVLQVNWESVNCAANALPTPETNAKRCFPVRWKPEGADERTDWFHKYVAHQTVATDQVGGAPTEVVTYQYEGDGAWAYNDDRLLVENRRTWSQWRGYEKVLVSKGNPNDPAVRRTAVRYQYYRGMHGDRLNPGGGTKTARITDSRNTTVDDLAGLSGVQREMITYNGIDGPEVSGEILEPMRRQTLVNGDGSRVAYQVRDERKIARVALPAAGGKRETATRMKYDEFGLMTELSDEGDVHNPQDDRCARTSYARNVAKWIVEVKSRQEAFRGNCDVAPVIPRDVVSDYKFTYDHRPWGSEPDRADATLTQKVSGYQGTTPTYVDDAVATFDVYGRQLDDVDVLGRKTSTRFEPETGLSTRTIVTNPLGHKVVTTNHPAWSQPVRVDDMNGRRTDLSYDAFGRLAEVWKPGRSKDAGDSGNLIHRYSLSRDKASAVETETLNASHGHTRSFELFDGFLRARQSQKQAWGGGRIITDSQYDSRGLVTRKNGPYFNTGELGAGLVRAADHEVSAQTALEYDGAEREVRSVFMSHNQPKHETITRHWGDHTDVIPPLGETTKSTYVDARGQVVELRQFKGREPTGEYDSTKYGHTDSGELASTTDTLGNVLASKYNLLGQRIESADPDRGVSVMEYDNAGQLRSRSDARGNKLFYRYDNLGRKTEERTGSENGPLITKWTYDQPGAIGQLASSTRYVGDQPYVTAVTEYDAEYRPARTEIRIPASENGIAGTYVFGQTYRADGSPASTVVPEVGDLPDETLVYNYDAMGLLRSLKGGGKDYVADMIYTKYGEPAQIHQGGPRNRLWQSRYYETGTRRVAQSLAERERAGSVLVNDATYAYDPTGNITKVSNNSREDGTDVQCFTYDHLRRNTESWTSTANCAGQPGSSVGGPMPYWTTYTYDKIGNRTSERRHGLGGAKDTVRQYDYDAVQPHAVRKITTTAPDGTTKADEYAYEKTGVTKSRPAPDGSPQSLGWNEEDRLTTVTANGRTTTTIYDADGKPLVVKDGTTTTLSLPNGELQVNVSTGARAATRYYGTGKENVAVRSGDRVAYQVSDQQGTGIVMVDSGTLAPVRRALDQFGQPRRAQPAEFPGKDGFVGGKKNDETGLTKLGVRDYDPAMGRFLSVDPLMVPENPQQLNGFSYSNNNPATFNDKSGMIAEDCYYNPRSCRESPRSSPSSGQAGYTPEAAREAGFGKKHRKDSRVIIQLKHKMPGKGVLMLRAFIPDELAGMNDLLGDNRSFSLNALAASRMIMVIDWENGLVSFTVTRSVTAPIKQAYGPDQPPRESEEIAAHPFDSDKLLHNSIDVTEHGPGKLEIKFSGLNSLYPCCPTKGNLQVEVDGYETRAELKGTPYPNYEMIHYRDGLEPRMIGAAVWRSGSPTDTFSWFVPDRTVTWGAGKPRFR